KKEELMEADPGTEDFLVATLREHEKFSWMLKSHLE
ncbi:MAG: DNA starvation/stationary phase protection protein, partial [Halobacteriovoraceae bacterium]|nr:DNA starvation/stationary phase protection protein [Halobacteriovoraceae bacterium]